MRESRVEKCGGVEGNKRVEGEENVFGEGGRNVRGEAKRGSEGEETKM